MMFAAVKPTFNLVTIYRVLPLLFSPLVLLTGCTDSDTEGRFAVSGQVSYDGKPVAEGSISLSRIDDPMQPQVTASVSQGAYSFSQAEGPSEGTYRVELRATKWVRDPNPYVPPYLEEQQASDPHAGMLEQQYLPPKYNDKSELQVQIGSDQVVHDFILEQ